MTVVTTKFTNVIHEYFEGIINDSLSVRKLDVDGDDVYEMEYGSTRVYVKAFYESSSYGHSEYLGWKFVEPKTKEVTVWE